MMTTRPEPTLATGFGNGKEFAGMHSGSNADFEGLLPLLSEIRAQAAPIESMTSRLRSVLQRMSTSSATSQKSAEYWNAVVFADSLVRVRLFIEQNFNYIETMGVLAVSRYLFELTVWLKLLEQDARYGLVYYYQLLKLQRDFYAALRKHSELEVLFLEEIERAENLMLERTLAEAMQIPQEGERATALNRAINQAAQKSDEDAARKFSLYAEQARQNGYGFQAHLVETKVVPMHAKTHDEVEREFRTFESQLDRSVSALIPKRWNWKEQAEKVGMGKEYEFIYLYTSLLMHATPVSVTTDQKNLELNEVRMFLKYIRVRIVDAVKLAEDFLSNHPAFIQ
jgi:hypothetical protein